MRGMRPFGYKLGRFVRHGPYLRLGILPIVSRRSYVYAPSHREGYVVEFSRLYQEHAHLTLLRAEGTAGLLLWAVDDKVIPRALRTAFSRGVWYEKVPMVILNKARQIGVKEARGWWLDA